MQIIPVSPAHQKFQDFLNLPWQIYPGAYHWLPPNKQTVRDSLDDTLNPFFKHGAAQAFLCIQDGTAVGRIVASYDLNLFNREHCGHVGYFESIDDSGVADALLSAAEDWLAAHHRKIIYGPVNLHIFQGYRLQISGFDTEPFPGEPRTPDYYVRLFAHSGYREHARWRSFTLPATCFSEIARYADEKTMRTRDARLLELKLRYVSPEHPEQDWRAIHRLVVDSFQYNFHCTDLSLEEYLRVIPTGALNNPGNFIIDDAEGQPVAFCWGYEDFTAPHATAADGAPRRIILHTIGMHQAYHASGLVYDMFRYVFKYLAEANYPSAIGAMVKAGPCIYEPWATLHGEYAVYRKQL